MSKINELYETYLGDGVYAHYDGYHVVLTITLGSKIYLDDKVQLEGKL